MGLEFNMDMVTVKFRFFNYRAAVRLGRGKTLIGEMILLRSDPYTHVEFQFSAKYNHLSFSSTQEDAFKGCRFKLIKYSNAWWTTLEVEITAEQEAQIWQRAHEINGKKYDLIGLLSFVTKWQIMVPNRNRYWCSEAIAHVITDVIYDGLLEIHPLDLYHEVINIQWSLK